MLQTVSSLAKEFAMLGPDPAPVPSGTAYFRSLHPDTVRDRVAPAEIVKSLQRSLYVMTELYVRDPNGYVICFGVADESMELRMSAAGRPNMSSIDAFRISGTGRRLAVFNCTAWRSEETDISAPP